jgi:hypothetical protein
MWLTLPVLADNPGNFLRQLILSDAQWGLLAAQCATQAN